MQQKKPQNNQSKDSIKKPQKGTSTASTSWGGVAAWYDDYLSSPDSYQQQVVLLNLLRWVAAKKGQRILDLACGQGFFSEHFANAGAEVVGADISAELIAKAKSRLPHVKFFVTPSHKFEQLLPASFDVVVCVLALQNIAELEATFAAAKRVLRPDGRFIFVLNHPAFRVPQGSDWYYNEATKKQGRVVTTYLSESTVKIDMHPGAEKKTFTISFHRSLQVFMKHLAKQKFAITRMEEWISHKKSAPGARAAAEDKARKEIPLFLAVECKLL